MKLLNTILALCCWSLTVNTQSISQVQRSKNDAQLNPSYIFFDDSRPIPNSNFQYPTEIGNNNQQDDRLFQQIPKVPDNVLLATEIPQNINFQNDGTNTDRKPVQPLSMELLPPPISNNSNYYSNNNTSKPTEEDRVGQVNQENTVIPHVLTNFGLSLLQITSRRVGNVVVSPYSIATLLALLQQGALGKTQLQITAALRMSREQSAQLFRIINEDFAKRNSHNILKVANNVYVADAFELRPDFKTIAQQGFGSEVTPIRFMRSQDAARQINQWVSEKTNNKINDLLSSDAVSENTQLVLVNAVYFKGLWQVKFKPESTLPKEFYMSNGATKIVPFLRMRRTFKTGIDWNNKAQVIILPFEKEQYSLMLVLPLEGSNLDILLATLTDTQLTQYHSLAPKEVDLEVPKFTARADTDLQPVLMKMGVTNMFTRQSELGNVGIFRRLAPAVSSAVHTAMLSIDEEGGSAAASTAFAVVALSYDDPSIIFKANRPFLSVLWDNKTGVPLFMARIEDPVL